MSAEDHETAAEHHRREAGKIRAELWLAKEHYNKAAQVNHHENLYIEHLELSRAKQSNQL